MVASWGSLIGNVEAIFKSGLEQATTPRKPQFVIRCVWGVYYVQYSNGFEWTTVDLHAEIPPVLGIPILSFTPPGLALFIHVNVKCILLCLEFFVRVWIYVHRVKRFHTFNIHKMKMNAMEMICITRTTQNQPYRCVGILCTRGWCCQWSGGPTGGSYPQYPYPGSLIMQVLKKKSVLCGIV